MITAALIFLLLLHFPAVYRINRLEVRRDGLWWATWYAGGKGARRIVRWPWWRDK